MVLHINDHEADRLTRELAARTGQPITRAVIEALREKLKREQGRPRFPRLEDEIMAISRRTAALPRPTFSYALSKSTGEPLLFKGADLSHTAVPRHLPP